MHVCVCGTYLGVVFCCMCVCVCVCVCVWVCVSDWESLIFSVISSVMFFVYVYTAFDDQR